MTAVDPDAKQGLYPHAQREEVTAPLFTLRYTTDPHAAVALAAYAKSC